MVKRCCNQALFHLFSMCDRAKFARRLIKRVSCRCIGIVPDDCVKKAHCVGVNIVAAALLRVVNRALGPGQAPVVQGIHDVANRVKDDACGFAAVFRIESDGVYCWVECHF